MAFNRPLLALVGGALAVVLVSLGGVAYVKLRMGPLAERLVREVNALARTGAPRPSHVTPALPGTFARHLEPLLAELVLRYRERPEKEEESRRGGGWPCLAVVEGQASITELPAVCRESLEGSRLLVTRVLEATHAEVGGLPAGLGVLTPPAHPYWTDGAMALLQVVRLAALEIRLQLSKGQVVEAVDTCLDAVAVNRELTLGGGLSGQMLSATGQGLVYRPCADALDVAPLERKRTAVAQLVRLSEGFAPFSRTLREESAVVQLMTFRELFSATTLEALPEDVRDFRLPVGVMEAAGNPVDARLSWWKTVRVFDELSAAADQTPEARRRAFAAIAARDAGALYAVEGPDVDSYREYAERVDVRRIQHDALVMLAEVDLERAEKGRWPETMASRAGGSFILEPSGPREALLRPCTQDLKQHALRVTSDLSPGAWTQPP